MGMSIRQKAETLTDFGSVLFKAITLSHLTMPLSLVYVTLSVLSLRITFYLNKVLVSRRV